MGYGNSGAVFSSLLHNAAAHASKKMILSLEQNAGGVVHEMEVPRILEDGSVINGKARANTFHRATILESLLDAREIKVQIPEKLIITECKRVIAARRMDVQGGWSYFDEVAELPPDIDDLGTVTRTLVRAGGKRYASCCEDALQYCFKSVDRNGHLGTWMLDSESPGYDRMQRYMKIIAKSEGCHAEVLANFLVGACAYYVDDSRDEILRLCADYILSLQQKNGSWRSNFYGSSCYATMMVLTALKAIGYKGGEVAAATNFLKSEQGPDGSWQGGDVLATACAIIALAISGEMNSNVNRGMQFVLLSQEVDGLWFPGTFVRVITPNGIHEQKSREVTGAFCVKAIAAYLNDGNLPWLRYERHISI